MTATVYLLDANVLLSLYMPEHEFYLRANAWFQAMDRPKWATCPFTQSAFVRLASHPAILPSPLTTRQATSLLADNLSSPGHVFWSDHLSFGQAIAPFSMRVTGHRQVTDAYLLGLAMNKKAKLATMDRGINALLPPEEASTWIAQI